MLVNETSPRDVGIVVWDCGGNLRSRVDLARLCRELRGVAGVAKVKLFRGSLDPARAAAAARSVLGRRARRLLVAGRNRPALEAAFGSLAGGRLLEHGMWWPLELDAAGALVGGDRAGATAYALDLLKSAVARLRFAEPVNARRRPLRRDVAVIGAGPAGMQAALTLADLDHNVTLIDSAFEPCGTVMPELLGHLASTPAEAEAEARLLLEDLSARIKTSNRITFHGGARVRSVNGEVGDFVLDFFAGPEPKRVHVGAVVLATGPAGKPAAAGGKTGPIGVADAAAILKSGVRLPRRLAIVLDLAAEQGRDVCGQALSLAERFSGRGSEVTLYCRHVRVAATGFESLYRRARSAGVVVVKYGTPPRISAAGASFIVACAEPVTGSRMREEYDAVVLADRAFGPGPEFVPGLRPGPDGAVQYDDVWLLSGLTSRPGIFGAGAARGNSEFREAQADGMAAALETHAMLEPGAMTVLADAAAVDPEKCVLCLTCVRVCPHGAISIDEQKKAASPSAVSCRRCGVCVAECPARAISLPGWTDEQLDSDAGAGSALTVFACENSGMPAAETAARLGLRAGAGIRLVRIPCAGRLDPRAILAALERGAQRVLVLGCHPASCRYLNGSDRAEKRVARLRAMLEKAGVDPTRVRFAGIASVEPMRLVELMGGEIRSQTPG